MTLQDADCDRCGGAGGLYADDVDTRFEALCLACAKALAKQDELEATASEVVA